MILPLHPPVFQTNQNHTPSLPLHLPQNFPQKKTMLDPVTNLQKTHVHVSDHTGHFSDSSDSYVRARKTAQNYANYRSWNSMGPIRFGFERKVGVDDDYEEEEEKESGVCSPPLWKTSPERRDFHGENHYWSLSPSSRTQAIERGQRELMEMVRNMPESCYELSLKDIVDQPPLMRQENLGIENGNQGVCRIAEEKKRSDRKAAMKRNWSIDNGGLLIKVGFPVSLGSKKNNTKKNKNSSVTIPSSKVSPKPQIPDGLGRGDKECQKKKSSVSGEIESCRFSFNSGSSKSSSSISSSSSSSRSNSRRRTGHSPSCWPFFLTKKSKTSA